jgi:uncharacterized membrane protein (UPF0127 family)
MGRVLITIIFLGILVHILSALYVNRSRGQGLVTIDGKAIKVEVAKTFEERERGLSGRAQLRDDIGMLFIFENPGIYGFWMKNMSFPIDIIWVGPDYKVVDVSARVSPSTFPKTFFPKEPVQYVLEVVSGWADINKVSVGKEVTLAL